MDGAGIGTKGTRYELVICLRVYQSSLSSYNKKYEAINL
jgi:hypothetical protein